MKYTRTEYINALMWTFGMTKTQAAKEVKEAIKNSDFGRIDEAVNAFNSNARKSFYND
jgi:hypothetical protein